MTAHLAILLGVFLVACTARASAAIEIQNVSTPRLQFDPTRGERAEIRFRLTQRAMLRIDIYDGRDVLVRQLLDPETAAAGEHSRYWDGRDILGQIVPAEAYRYVIEASGAEGDTARWDLSDATGGEPVSVRDLAWSRERGTVTFVVERPARVRIRAGLSGGGPLLDTLLDWVPRAPGTHRVAWNGKDSSGVLDLAANERLTWSAEAFTLSENTLIVAPETERVAWSEGLDLGKRRTPTKIKRKRMFQYAAQSLEQRRDFPVRIEVKGASAENPDGLPVISQPVRIRIEVDPEHRQRILDERFEGVYFLDGELLFENEVGFLPVTWSFDPKGLAPGIHYITTNLRGYDGHFGIATIAVRVQ